MGGFQVAAAFQCGATQIQFVQGRFYLTFGQLNLPVLLTAPSADFVAEIRPVARLIVLPGDIERMVDALQKVLELAHAADQEK